MLMTSSEGVDLLLLEQVLAYLKNWFVMEVKTGDFTITDGIISEELKPGQYYRIMGSVYNDGLHQYEEDTQTDEENSLTDEEFSGSVWALAVPAVIISLVKDIGEWQTKFGDIAASPLNSESFNGYSYSKSSGVTEGGGVGGWQAAFKGRLAPWRKL